MLSLFILLAYSWDNNLPWVITTDSDDRRISEITVKDCSFSGGAHDGREAVIDIRWKYTKKLVVENVYFYNVDNMYENACGCILVGEYIKMEYFSIKKVCAYNVKSTKSCFFCFNLNTSELTSIYNCETTSTGSCFIELKNLQPNSVLSNFNISSCKSNKGFRIDSQCSMSFVNFQSNNFVESDLDIGAEISLNYSNFVQCNSVAIMSNSYSTILRNYFVGAKSIKVSNNQLVFIECYFDFDHSSILGPISTTDCIFSSNILPTNFDIFSLSKCANVPYPEGSWNTPIPPSESPAETPPRTMPEDCIINNGENPKGKWKKIRRIYCFIASSFTVAWSCYKF